MKMSWEYVILFSTIVTIVLDGTYIGINLDRYKKVIHKIQGRELVFRRIEPILFCYLCLIGGLHWFIIREKKSIIEAFCLGVVIYGVYATTIYTMFSQYPAYLAIMDTLWGGVLFGLTTLITYTALG
jgi:uncharacterized membrane protein